MWSFTGLLGRAALSTVMVIAATRALGVEDYGVLVGVVAFVNLFAPLNAMGAGEVLIQRVAQSRDNFRAAWGAVFALLLTVGTVLYLVMVLLGALILPSVDPLTIAVFGAAEFVAAGVIGNNVRAYAALDRYRSLAVCYLAEGTARAGAAVVFWASASTDLLVLGLLMLGGLTIVALGTSLALGHHWGLPTRPTRSLADEGRAGAPFAITQTSDMVQTNIDKALLLSFGLDRDAGIYGAGYRLSSYAMMPVMAVLSAAYPEFFRRGQVGLASAMAYSKRLRRPLMGLAILAGVGAAALSPVAAWAFGDQFGGVVPVAVGLSAYPLVKALQALWGDVLTGTGHQSYRSRVQVATAVLNIAVNLVLIPPFGWQGALVATYISEMVLLGLLVRRVKALYRTRRLDRLAEDPPDGERDVTP